MSDTHIVYTAKDPLLPEAWHTKQNVETLFFVVSDGHSQNLQVYIVPISGDKQPIELTSGKQGATHGPCFNTQGTKVAWLELDEDGYESDRYDPSNTIAGMLGLMTYKIQDCYLRP